MLNAKTQTDILTAERDALCNWLLYAKYYSSYYERKDVSDENVFPFRITSREEMHRHLSNPKSFNVDSGMPAYRDLYTKSQLKDGKFIPSGKAEALVTYLLSRKKDAKIPAADPRGQ